MLTFVLSPVPIGPPLVWVPAGPVADPDGQTGWGIFVLLWGTFAVSTIDNIIKPLIISRGVDLPFVLVLLGVLGGAIAFGFIGIFLGPVLLAVGYALLMEWAASRGRIDCSPTPQATGAQRSVDATRSNRGDDRATRLRRRARPRAIAA